MLVSAEGPSDIVLQPAVLTAIGHADSWEQLQWMARGAAPFERAGRLWALNNKTHTVLFMADIRLDRDPHATHPENQR